MQNQINTAHDINAALISAIQAQNSKEEGDVVQNNKEQDYNITDLELYKKNLQLGIRMYEFRKPRIEALMKRRSSNSWTPRKKQKMIRRLELAESYIDQAPHMIEMVDKEIQRIKFK